MKSSFLPLIAAAALCWPGIGTAQSGRGAFTPENNPLIAFDRLPALADKCETASKQTVSVEVCGDYLEKLQTYLELRQRQYRICAEQMRTAAGEIERGYGAPTDAICREEVAFEDDPAVIRYNKVARRLGLPAM